GIIVLSFEGVKQQPPETYNSSQYASGANDRSTTQLQNVSAGSLVVSVVCNGSSGGYDGNVGGAGGAGIRQSEGDPSSAGMGVSTDLSSTGGTFNVVDISEHHKQGHPHRLGLCCCSQLPSDPGTYAEFLGGWNRVYENEGVFEEYAIRH
ncbi:MAG: hypothetical protein ACWGQW_16325, partial [bacterium]